MKGGNRAGHSWSGLGFGLWRVCTAHNVTSGLQVQHNRSFWLKITTIQQHFTRSPMAPKKDGAKAVAMHCPLSGHGTRGRSCQRPTSSICSFQGMSFCCSWLLECFLQGHGISWLCGSQWLHLVEYLKHCSFKPQMSFWMEDAC